MAFGPTPMTLEERIARFWSYVDKTPGLGPEGDCWEWTGSLLGKGYGQFPSGKQICDERLAHRISYKLKHPKRNIEEKMICHDCDNMKCVRPSHLFRGTALTNNRDMYAKGRGYWSSKAHGKEVRRRNLKRDYSKSKNLFGLRIRGRKSCSK